MELKAEHIKPYDAERAKSEQVREMFDSIAPAYDWMNRAMTFGLDKQWRRTTVRCVSQFNPRRVIDLAAGTGDLAIALAEAMPQALITGLDLSSGMVAIGREKLVQNGLACRVSLECGDCLAMPYDDNSTDAITIAFGVRNFENLDRGYAEMYRVVRPGGQIFVLELSTPVNPLVKPFYKLYSRGIIPFLGRIVSKDRRAYSYLPESIAAVPQGEDMLRLIADAGFRDTKFRRMTLGVCTLYMATKPSV